MNKIKNLFECLCFDEIKYVKENFFQYECSFKSKLSGSIDIDAFCFALKFLSYRDSIILSICVNDGETVQYDSRTNDVNGFIIGVSDSFKYIIDSDPIIECSIIIYKEVTDRSLSIYSLEDFIIFLENLSFIDCLNEFSKVILTYEGIFFELISDEVYLKTGAFLFSNVKQEFITNAIDRTQAITNAKSSCHFSHLSKYEFLPNDFHVLSSNSARLEGIFSVISITLSIAFIFDIVTIDSNDLLHYRLNGYKTLKGSIDLKKIDVLVNLQYFEIYKWVYGTGTFIDKLGLARNIVSLHVDGINNIDIKGDAILAIQSSYKIYEKQNIKQYIEIRNKISDQLLSFHDRANKIVETFASGFQKSSLALITFYTSAIILRILKNDNLINIFTIDAAILSSVFIACSWGYYYALNRELKAQKVRFERHYENIKDRYKDLLNEQDILRILNNDQEFKEDLGFMEDKISTYKDLWMLELVLLFFATWGLYYIYNR